eukprot:CAMPEP_0171163626 /NCGR_PEP_ID=MMETSP0790-20130122/5246_1 /TAXON_ID=2925 /ORGANISM="Alexandrium catenella, Strain OF101" /LENGTH=535 /DNA_ID=CAMNT_0011628349 /DNA_START=95 /DNA_END=1702 /DNA_ORIENTATION=-
MSSGDESGGGGCLGGIMNACIAMLLGVVMYPCALGLLGWNEQSFVCDNHRILFADQNAKEVGCSSTGLVDEFVFFSCPYVRSSLETFTMSTFNRQQVMNQATAPPINFTAAAGRQVAEMLSCKESCKEENHKNAMGQNVKTKTCTWQLTWSENTIPSTFSRPLQEVNQNGCPGVQQAGGNPAAPTNLDLGVRTTHATDIHVGDPNASYWLNPDLIQSIPASDPVNLQPFESKFAVGRTTVINNQQPWLRPLQITTANTMIQDGKYLTTCATEGLGCVRVSFFRSNSSAPSVIARVQTGGQLGKEQIPGSWGCEAGGWQRLVPETLDKEGMIEALQDFNRIKVWVIRIVGLLLCFLAVWLCLSPITSAAEFVGDCLNFIPCGGYLDDLLVGLVGQVVCMIACAFGCASGLFVIALVWLYMRPLYGGLMMAGVVGLCLCGCAVRSCASKKQVGRGKGGRGGRAPVDPSLAQGFLEAARAEYVYGAPRAVESFFDGQGVEPEDQEALNPYEDQIRNAYDKHQAISQLQAQWGLSASDE